ncbi:MAG: hypothetical protein ACLP7O_10550 [Terracidiphilus sp.]
MAAVLIEHNDHRRLDAPLLRFHQERSGPVVNELHGCGGEPLQTQAPAVLKAGFGIYFIG